MNFLSQYRIPWTIYRTCLQHIEGALWQMKYRVGAKVIHIKRNHFSDSHGNDQGSKYVSLWIHLLIEKPAQWAEIEKKQDNSIEIKT